MSLHPTPAHELRPRFYAAEAAESTTLRQGLTYWLTLKGERRFPDRNQVTLRGLRGLAKYAVLVRVLDEGRDYEFRFIGDVPVSAVGWNFQGRRMSEPEISQIMTANYRRQLYDKVASTGEPCLFKCGSVERPSVRLPMLSETLFLPLGASDDAVDHLLGFTVFSAALS